MPTITVIKNYVEEECISCGCVFFLPNNLYRQKKCDKTNFYCPNGHGQHYSKSTADELREELAKKNQLIVDKDNRIAELISKADQKRKRGRPSKK